MVQSGSPGFDIPSPAPPKRQASCFPVCLPSSASLLVVYTGISKAIFNHLGSYRLKHNKMFYFGQYLVSQNLSVASALQ